MPKIKKILVLNLKVFKIVFFFFLIFQVLNSKAQGLLFNSNDSLVTKRTSLHVFSSNIPVFQDHLSINFDLSLWDNAHLGYVFNLADRDNSYSLSYLYMDGAGYLNFNIDRQSNKIEIPLQASMLRKGKWMKVKIDLDLKDDKVSIYINGVVYKADKFGFKRQIPGNLVFGKNQYYTEVPNMAIKNLSVSDADKNYSFLLDEWRGNQVHDREGEVKGSVENPVWLINQSFFWKQAYMQSFKQVVGLNFNTTDQNLFIFKRDSLIIFDSELRGATGIPYKNKLPVSMVLGKSIFNAKENKCYIYELFDIPNGLPSVAALNMDKNNLQWKAIGKAILPKQRHHHNIFYDLKQDTFYMFGGYGGYKYYNTFLKYDRTTDNWEKVNFKGDVISPRFFAAIGNADNPDEMFLFGGYGNESGNQIVGGKQFFDLYRINLKNHTIKKCWTIRPHGKEVFVPANNLVPSADKKYFYALCYPHEIAKTEIKLYKFSIRDGSYEVVSAPIPVTSERIESDINLFFNTKTNEFYCTIQEFTDRINSTIKIFSLLAPPVGADRYLKSLNPQKASLNTFIYIGISVVIMLIAAGLVFMYKRKPIDRFLEPENDNVLMPEKIDVEKKRNTVYLLGEFLVFDKNGKDMTYLFSPKIKQLFILILLNSRDGNGITSKKISCNLWPDKDLAKTKNIKGVTFNHLRSIISDINGIELAFENDNYLFNTSEDFFCDYFFITSLIKENQAHNERLVLEHFDLLSRGKLLGDMSDQWLDDFKNNYEEQLTNVLLPELKKHYEASDLKLTLDMSKLIIDIDPFNDTALKYQLKALRKLKGIDYARRVYEQFTVEYKKSFGTEYHNSLDKTIQ